MLYLKYSDCQAKCDEKINFVLPACADTQTGSAFANQPLSEVLTQAQKQDFLKHFACLCCATARRQAKTHEDWQVKQAEATFRLYDYYLSLLQMPANEKSLKNKEKWSVVEANAQNLCRQSRARRRLGLGDSCFLLASDLPYRFGNV